jgi:hypothetical protein
MFRQNPSVNRNSGQRARLARGGAGARNRAARQATRSNVGAVAGSHTRALAHDVQHKPRSASIAAGGWNGDAMSKSARDSSTKTRTPARRVALGMAVGCFAGVPQVLLAQLNGALAGSRRQADVGPRLVQRLGRLAGRSPSRPERWSLAALFHFAYAAGWGAAYAAAIEVVGVRRVPPALAGGALGALIYAIAFSRLGVGTLTGAERHPDRRGERDWIVQLTSAFSFALILAYAYRWSRERGS